MPPTADGEPDAHRQIRVFSALRHPSLASTDRDLPPLFNSEKAIHGESFPRPKLLIFSGEGRKSPIPVSAPRRHRIVHRAGSGCATGRARDVGATITHPAAPALTGQRGIQSEETTRGGPRGCQMVAESDHYQLRG